MPKQKRKEKTHPSTSHRGGGRGSPQATQTQNRVSVNGKDSSPRAAMEETATITNNVAIGRSTIIHSRTTIRGPAIIADHCTIGPNTYIGPHTTIGDHAAIRKTKIQNTIIMDGTHIDSSRLADFLYGYHPKFKHLKTNIRIQL